MAKHRIYNYLRASISKGFLIPLLLAVVPGSAGAGAWTQAPGTAYVRLSGGYLGTDTRLDENGDSVPFDAAGGGTRDTEYRDLAWSLYTEVGLSREWTAIGTLSFKRVEARQPSAIFRTWGTADMTLGLKYGWWRRGPTVASASVMFTFPTGYDPEDYPALGSDAMDATIVLQAGTSRISHWLNAEVFYTHRGGDFRSQLGGSLGGGSGPYRGFSLRGEVRGFAPVGALASAVDARFDPARVDPTHVDLATTLSWQAGPGVALEGEVRKTVWGKNTLEAPRWSLALATSPAWSVAR